MSNVSRLASAQEKKGAARGSIGSNNTSKDRQARQALLGASAAGFVNLTLARPSLLTYLIRSSRLRPPIVQRRDHSRPQAGSHRGSRIEEIIRFCSVKPKTRLAAKCYGDTFGTFSRLRSSSAHDRRASLYWRDLSLSARARQALAYAGWQRSGPLLLHLLPSRDWSHASNDIYHPAEAALPAFARQRPTVVSLSDYLKLEPPSPILLCFFLSHSQPHFPGNFTLLAGNLI